MKQKRFITLDVESTGLGGKAYVFDIAYTIATRNKVLLERQFLVREILTNSRIMLSAYESNDWRDMMGKKIFVDYIPMLSNSETRLYGWQDIVETMRDDMLEYGVDVFAAYNLRFDMGALSNTHRYIGHKEKILPYRPDLLCLWEFAASTLCNTPMYHRIAREMGKETGWITPANNVRTNAEKVYAFISQNLNFVESHTALSDAQIETEILQRLLARKKRIPYNVLDHMPWKKAQIIGL